MYLTINWNSNSVIIGDMSIPFIGGIRRLIGANISSVNASKVRIGSSFQLMFGKKLRKHLSITNQKIICAMLYIAKDNIFSP